jgi:hypothetical protein
LWGFSEKQSKEEQKSKALWGIHLKIKTRAPDGFGMGCGGVCGGDGGNYVGAVVGLWRRVEQESLEG